MSVTDVVVVGGGLAGLTAANRAREAGLSVVVLEKGEDERYLCNSRIASGSFNLAHCDPTGEPAHLRQAILDDTEGAADPALAQALANVAGPAMQWFRNEGAKFIKVTRAEKEARWSMAPPRPSKPGFGWEGRGPDQALRCLEANLKKRGGTLTLGVQAKKLLMENGRCVGVSATKGGQPVEFRARNVVLADGGFQGNPDLVRRFISKQPEKLTQRNAKSGKGDALMMAEEVGAALVGTNRFYGHLLVQESLNNPLLWPYPTLDSLASSAIVVDASGRRFMDEGLGGVAMTNAIAALDDPFSTVTIFDNAMWETTGKAEFTPPNPYLVSGGGTLTTANTIEELAGKLELPAAALAETIRDYNAAVEAGAFDRLTPPRTPGRLFGVLRTSDLRTSVLPIKDGPFHAVRLCAGITYTMGGIAVDPKGRVLATSGSPIEGLYAAGACTGGLEGGPVAGYIGGLCKALSMGYIAAASIAADVVDAR
jgi:fumarate reductase flavoprotein subunit